MLSFILLQFITMRYASSQDTQLVFYTVRSKLDSLFAYTPEVVRNLWFKLTNTLTMYGAQLLAARAQQQQ